MASFYKKTALPFALFLVLLLGSVRAQQANPPSPGPSCGYSEPSNSFSYKSNTDSAGYSTASPYGTCGSCYLSLYASQGMTKDQPGKPTKTISATLYMSCYDYCSNAPSYSAEYASSDSTGINIKQNQASISTSLTLQYGSSSTGDLPTTASVNVQAQPDGQNGGKGNCNSVYTYTDPCGVVTVTHSTSSSGSQSATFTGSITVGSTTYTLPISGGYFSYGSISKSDYMYRTRVKTH